MYGLVLEGGGARGAYHIGAYRALNEQGMEFQGVTGTSIGALNGAMIVQGDYERCHEIWHDVKYSMVIDADDEEMERIRQPKRTKEEWSMLAGRIKTIIADRGFDITPARNLIDTHIDENKIRRSGKDFGMVTVSLTDRRPLNVFLEDIPTGELKDFLIASSYLPIFKSEKINGKTYLDGGLYDNLPFNMLKDKGYENLILVRTNAMGFTRKVKLPELNVLMISPSESLGRTFDFESNRARKNINLGYYDGLKAIKGLLGTKYYVESRKDEDYYLEYLLGLTESQVRQIEKILKLPEIPYRRSLLENIIPKISSMLGIDKDCSYEDLTIGLLEKMAEELCIERFEIYTFEELFDKIKGKKYIKDKEEVSRLNRIIEKVDIIPILNKEEALLEIASIVFDKRD